MSEYHVYEKKERKKKEKRGACMGGTTVTLLHLTYCSAASTYYSAALTYSSNAVAYSYYCYTTNFT